MGTATLEKKRLAESEHSPIREALGGRSTGLKREITIARAGWGSSGYYSEDVLRRDGPRVFPVGTKMYIDHPSITEETDRPERSIQHMAAIITRTPRMAGIDLVAECELVEHWAPVINNLADRGMLDLSLRAYGLEEVGAAGGRQGPIITELLEGISVDFVTEGGLGGKVGKLIEEAVRATPVQEKLASTIREGLASAGKERWGGRDTYVYLEDYDHEEAYAIFCVSPEGSESYYLKISYKEEDGECVLTGEPEEVDRQIQYVPDGTGGGGDSYSESMPAHLKEARNVGHYLEAYIHRTFTEAADRHFGDGYLTREERISLSNALGEALKAFASTIESDQPQLFQRDIYADPTAETTVSERNNRSGGSNRGGPGMGNEDGLSELREEIRRNKEDTDKRLKESEDRASAAETRADRAEDKLQMIEAGKAVDRVIGGVEGLPDRAQQRVIESVLNKGIPTTSGGAIDTGVLEERARAEIRAEQEYLAGAGGSKEGQVSTFGESSRNGGAAEADSNLEKVLRRRGLSESGAKVAAEGRRD